MSKSWSKGTVSIEIENITPPQTMALKKMFEQMQYMGLIGTSDWVGFYSDGDGDFRPKITKFDYSADLPESAVKPRFIDNLRIIGIDYDKIAWEYVENKGDRF